MRVVDRILGPRVPPEEMASGRVQYRLPKLLFGLASVMLIVSLVLPYWNLHLVAPQFPSGLHIQAFVNRLEGDVIQLEELNHYIGMASFADGAKFERSIAVVSIIAMAGLILASMLIHSRWVTVFVTPALLFPVIFLADLQWWLWKYGHELDPRAPFADAVGDFTPHILGRAEIAQFDTNALPGPGLYLATLASLAIIVGLWFHRKAYKPLVEAAESDEASGGAPQPSAESV